MLGLLGGAGAIAVARLVIEAIARTAPQDLAATSPFTIAMETRVLWFVGAAALLASMLLGLVPAFGLRLASTSTVASEAAHGGRSAHRIRKSLVAAQMALSTVLLAGAVLLGAGLTRLLHVEVGFDHERLAFAVLVLEPPRYPDAAARADFVQRLEDRLLELPEVSGVTATGGTGFVVEPALEAEGEGVRPGQPELLPLGAVDADYITVTGTRVTLGRGFQPSDAGTDNAIIDRDLARFLWGGRDPIGRRFRPDASYPWLTVVGVAEELRLKGRDDRTSPYQFVVAGDPALGRFPMLLLRTDGNPRRLLPLMERALWSLDPEQTYYELLTADQMLAIYEEHPRFLTGLIGALSLVAVLLAAVGLYGVLAYAVTRRRHEIGIRVALGAQPAHVRRSVVGEGLVMAGVGSGLGLVAAYVLARSLEPFLYAVDPHDPALFAATAALLLTVAVLASFLPAQRATRVDPIQVLKAD